MSPSETALGNASGEAGTDTKHATKVRATSNHAVSRWNRTTLPTAINEGFPNCRVGVRNAVFFTHRSVDAAARTPPNRVFSARTPPNAPHRDADDDPSPDFVRRTR
jgi:hypothetical protein